MKRNDQKKFPSMAKWVIVLLGPTASGKSELAIPLAQALDTEIICADSRQVYQGFDIGTAKPSARERREVPHHLVDCVNSSETFSVGDFKPMAEKVIDSLHQKNRIPVIVGGTGLYIRVLRGGICDGPSAQWDLRKQLYLEAQKSGAEILHRRLTQIDPESARNIHPRDTVKVIRALEVFAISGKPLAALKKAHGFRQNRYRFLLFGLRLERADLYRRIEERVDRMIELGLVEEVRQLRRSGCHREMNAMQGLGYKQVASFLDGDMTYEQMIWVFKRETRRFAKRQMTWFKKEQGIHWMEVRQGSPSTTVLPELLNSIRDQIQCNDRKVPFAERSKAC